MITLPPTADLRLDRYAHNTRFKGGIYVEGFEKLAAFETAVASQPMRHARLRKTYGFGHCAHAH